MGSARSLRVTLQEKGRREDPSHGTMAWFDPKTRSGGPSWQRQTPTTSRYHSRGGGLLVAEDGGVRLHELPNKAAARLEMGRDAEDVVGRSVGSRGGHFLRRYPYVFVPLGVRHFKIPCSNTCILWE
jgi:hypothetical protein